MKYSIWKIPANISTFSYAPTGQVIKYSFSSSKDKLSFLEGEKVIILSLQPNESFNIGITIIEKDGTNISFTKDFEKSNGVLLSEISDELRLKIISTEANYVSISEDEYNEIYYKIFSVSSKQISIKGKVSATQIIYYGAPGTGKSFTVREKYEKDKDESFICRTTFHPDMDYSMFVGCYKPTQKQQSVQLLDYNELENKLKEFKASGATYPCQKFAAKYWQSFQRLKAAQIKKMLKDCGFTKNYDVEVAKGVAIGQDQQIGSNDRNITYEFVPQIFTDAYVKAWNDLDNAYYLIIEEINRGNCAQIFGDLFQLLDRDKKTGLSNYRIKADNDLRDYLKDNLPAECYGIADDKLCLPKNLSIIATMNTSDQSLFPMDSAFKRRWEWIYVPIEYEKEFTIDNIKKENRSYYFTIKIDEEHQYSWIKFIKQVNDKIFRLTDSEDKKIGNYFVDLPEGEIIINEQTFKNKVMFYLWNDVCKDEQGNSNNFYRTRDKEFSFNQLFEEKGQDLIIGFFDSFEDDLTPIKKDGASQDSLPKDSNPNSNPESAPEGNPEDNN